MSGLGVGAVAVSRTMGGGLRDACDTTWPFYGTLAGTSLLVLPVAFLVLPVTMSVGVLVRSSTPGIGLAVVVARRSDVGADAPE